MSRSIASYADLVVATWNHKVLFSVLLELTHACNLDCAFCYNDRNKQGAALTLNEYLDLLSQLRDLEVLHLVLSGGEPLAHCHFFEIGRHARSLGFVVRIKTNAHAVTAEVAQRLCDEIDPLQVDVSIHGATAAVHDRQTRVPGSFEVLMANLRHMLAVGLRLRLCCPLTCWNEHQMEELVNLARSLGLTINLEPTITPRDDGDLAPTHLVPTDAALLRLADLKRRLREEAEPSSNLSEGRTIDQEAPPPSSAHLCGAAASTLAIDPYGNVYPCVQWRQLLGNLSETTIREIWSSPAVDRIRELTCTAKQMVEGLGEHGRFAAFCPGHAVTEAGSPLKLYPDARRRLRLFEPSPSDPDD